jgi:hypothetical protein
VPGGMAGEWVAGLASVFARGFVVIGGERGEVASDSRRGYEPGVPPVGVWVTAGLGKRGTESGTAGALFWPGPP